MLAHMARLPLVLMGLLALLAAFLWVWSGSATPSSSQIAMPGTARASNPGPEDARLHSGESAQSPQRELLPESEFAAQAAQPESSASAATFELEVAVLDPEGTPIPGATIESDEPTRQTRTSDEQGTARFALPSGTRRVALFVDADGFMHVRDSWRTAARIEVTLQRSTSAHGRVVEKDTLVALREATVWLEDGHPGCQAERKPVAADGTFELAEVPVGASFAVAAASPGYADGRVSLRLLEGETSTGVQVELERSAGVQLRFVDFQTQRPIAGARVTNFAELPTSDERGLLDASRLASQSSTSFLIHATAPGYCSLLRHVQTPEWSETGVATVSLIAGARYEGLVRDAAGQPLPGARIELQARNQQSNRFDASVQLKLAGWESNWMVGAESMDGVLSDAAGRFASLAVPPQSAVWRLEVSAEGHATSVVDPGPTGDPGEATWVEVQLTPARAGKIRGHLTLNGAPTAGQILWTCGRAAGRASADPAGSFNLEDVEPGEVRLSAEVADGPRRYGRLFEDQSVTVALAPLAEVERDLALQMPVAATSGVVRTQRGDPRAGVEVRATLPDRDASLRTKSGPDGRFELELPVMPQTWTLSARGPWAAEPVQALAGARDLVLLVTEVGRLRLRLIDEEDGQPLRRFEVLARQSNERASRGVASSERNATDPAGWIEVSAPSGPLDVTLVPQDRDYMQVRSSLVVPSADSDALKVELATSRGSLLRLELSVESDRPPRRSQLYLLEESEARFLPPQGSAEERRNALAASVDMEALRARRVAFDPEGRTSLPGLRAGRYLLVDLGGGSFEPSEIELPRDAGALSVSWKPRR
jgi:hypothetical protein